MRYRWPRRVSGTRVTGPELARHCWRGSIRTTGRNSTGLAAAMGFVLEALRANKDTGPALEWDGDIGLQRLL